LKPIKPAYSDIKSICDEGDEERQKFCKLVHDLLRDNKWMLLEEAQRIAYQQVCVESVE
jgi:hypothetical protein